MNLILSSAAKKKKTATFDVISAKKNASVCTCTSAASSTKKNKSIVSSKLRNRRLLTLTRDNWNISDTSEAGGVFPINYYIVVSLSLMFQSVPASVFVLLRASSFLRYSN